MELSKYLLKRGVMVCSCESCTLTNVFFCNCKQKIPGTSWLTLQVVVLQSVVHWKVRCFLSLVQSKRQTDTWKLSLLLKSSSPIVDCLINQSLSSICTGENACPTEGNELNKGTKRWFIKIPPSLMSFNAVSSSVNYDDETQLFSFLEIKLLAL